MKVIGITITTAEKVITCAVGIAATIGTYVMAHAATEGAKKAFNKCVDNTFDNISSVVKGGQVPNFGMNKKSKDTISEEDILKEFLHDEEEAEE